ncbi:hypothetical protein [Anoxybacteroides tepidamans]|uniref:hypothetical protein n=1 Tax=Anoxybacteroides tepidamans TaxID=265948 RepID=UPI000A52F7EC|nr:hypothetical protein [Anoxybacillus tepidamans]
MEEVLSRIFDELSFLRQHMATKDDLAAMNKRIERVEQTMATKEDVAAMDKRIEQIEEAMATKDDLAAMNKRIENIEQTMATKEDVKEIPFIKQAVLEMQEAVREIPTIKQTLAEALRKLDDVIASQARQELVLQSLAFRSLEHENEIRSLKAKQPLSITQPYPSHDDIIPKNKSSNRE